MKFKWFNDAWHLARPFWRDKPQALWWLGIIIIFSLLDVSMSVWLNKWNATFFNAIQNYNKAAFVTALFNGLAIMGLAVAVKLIAYYFRSILEIKWRKWLTHFYLTDWIDSNSYYKSRFTAAQLDNPDQRISEDIREFIELTLSLFIGGFSALITLASFVIILWGLSGNFKFNLFHQHFHIPGYMVWMAILYALLGTYITFKIGRPLIRLTYEQQSYEADFRYNLVRVREYAEHVASYNGGAVEKKIITKDFDNIVTNFRHSLNRNLKINLFNFAYLQVSNIVPTVISAGRYFSREITLGNMMQITSAFGQVQFSITYFIFAYSTIATWRAVMARLLGFEQIIHAVKQLPEIRIMPHHQRPAGAKLSTQKTILAAKSYLVINNLQIKLPDAKQLVHSFSVTLQNGERLLIQGAAGVGKTTLFKALNGLWPYTTGEVSMTPGLSSLFIAQQPYLPRTSLRESICYPQSRNLPNDNELTQVLTECGLAHLSDKLHQSSAWSQALSLGEQQKIAFCRIIINKPDILYLDEVTSALDERSEKYLYTKIIKLLPDSIIISIGHRATLTALHTRIIKLSS